MNLKISQREIDGITVLDVAGRIVLGDETELFRDSIKNSLAGGKKSILLNLGEVAFIDSSGIGELVSASLAFRREGGDLKLLNLTKKVHDVVQIVKLGSMFEIFDDEDTALEAFKKQEREVRDLRVRAG
jgi:anti-sigma B factor antagonist